MSTQSLSKQHDNAAAVKKRRFLKSVRLLARFILRVIAQVRIQGYEHLPASGAAIVVTNHVGRLDAMLGVVLAERDDLILFVAEKYQKYAFWRWWVRMVDGIWLNRYEADLQAMRQAYRRLLQGELMGIAPEGTRSPTGVLAHGKPGAAYLASRANVPVVPVALLGTEDRVVVQRFKRLQRLRIDITIGESFTLPPRDRQQPRDVYLEQCTDEIMCRIAVLLPPERRGVYADHPRLHALLAEQATRVDS